MLEVQFEQTAYTASEGSGRVDVCVSIQSNATLLLTGNSFVELQLMTQAGTASGRLWMLANVPLII